MNSPRLPLVPSGCAVLGLLLVSSLPAQTTLSSGGLDIEFSATGQIETLSYGGTVFFGAGYGGSSFDLTLEDGTPFTWELGAAEEGAVVFRGTAGDVVVERKHMIITPLEGLSSTVPALGTQIWVTGAGGRVLGTESFFLGGAQAPADPLPAWAGYEDVLSGGLFRLTGRGSDEAAVVTGAELGSGWSFSSGSALSTASSVAGASTVLSYTFEGSDEAPGLFQWVQGYGFGDAEAFDTYMQAYGLFVGVPGGGVIPEPSTWAALAGVAALVVAVGRRRRNR